jgi:hypothetical protein
LISSKKYVDSENNHNTVSKKEGNHGVEVFVVVFYNFYQLPVSPSSTVFTAASFNSVVVEPHFKCGYTIKESSLLLLTYYKLHTKCGVK